MLGYRANEGRILEALMPISSAVVVAQCHWISSRLLQGLARSASLARRWFNIMTSRGFGGAF
jgi:hypothetical protein